jgi:hypothetical protein
MSKDDFYRDKWLKAEERIKKRDEKIKALEKEIRQLKESFGDFRNLQLETSRLQADLDAVIRPTGTPKREWDICLHCNQKISEVNPFRRKGSIYCSDSCRKNSNALVSYHSKKTGI